MARITRPEDQPFLSQARTSVPRGVAADSIGEAIVRTGQQYKQTSIGALSDQLGQLVSREGERLFEETKGAHQTALFSNKMNEATLQFMSARQQRVSRMTDDKGNPLFTTLPQDIGSIGKNIAESVANSITDPEVAQKFRNSFGNYVANQQIQSLGTARQQQIQFAQSSLDKGLGGIIQQAASDTVTNLDAYIVRGQELLDSSLAGGIISPQDHTRLSSQFRETAVEASLQTTISSSPQVAGELLKQPAESLGISEEKKSLLEELLDAKIQSDVEERQKIEAQQEREVKTKQAVLAEDIAAKIDADAIRQDELLKQRPKLPPQTFSELKTKYATAARQRQKETLALSEVSNAIANGQSTAAISGKLRDKHFSLAVEAASHASGKPLTLTQQASIAAAYKAPIDSFSSEVSASLMSGTPGKAAEALSAYIYSRDRGSAALNPRDISKDSIAMAELAEMYVEKAGITPEEAIVKARESINVPPEAKRIYASDFRKLSDFKPENLQSTAAKALGAHRWFSRNIPVSQQAAIDYRKLVETMYTTHGDLEAAKKTASNMMMTRYGISEVNGSQQFMLTPPEKILPGVDPMAIRNNIIVEVGNVVPMGIDLSTVQIYADDSTRGRFTQDGREIISYGLSYETATGIRVPLVNPETGELMRWVPDARGFERQRQQALSDKVAKAEEADNRARAIEADRQEAVERIKTGSPYSSRTTHLRGFVNNILDPEDN